MNLAGQGNRRKPGPRGRGRRSRLDDNGYIMVVLLIGIAVSAVWMTALLPSWHQQATREKEAELIFRGEQYARAIALYYRKNGNSLPLNIDLLVSQRYLRKKWKDPITGKDFVPITGSGTQGGPGQQAQMGILGVRSESTAQSVRIYNGQQTYSQMLFTYQQAMQRMNVPGFGAGNSVGGPPGTATGGRGGVTGPGGGRVGVAPGGGAQSGPGGGPGFGPGIGPGTGPASGQRGQSPVTGPNPGGVGTTPRGATPNAPFLGGAGR